MTVLRIRGLAKSFGALTVARSIDFDLERGARHALIGPNGAGKTTFVNLVTGALAPSAGRIEIRGEDVTHLGQAERSRRGIARTFQINQLFRGSSVLDNVSLAVSERDGTARSMLRPFGRRRHMVDESITLLESLGLQDEALRTVGELAYGKQRLVEIAIALAQRPSVLLLDEPAAGVPSSESRLILDIIDSLDEQIAVLIIEHDMELVFRLARRITVMHSGAVLAEGTPDEIAADDEVRAVYLGTTGDG